MTMPTDPLASVQVGLANWTTDAGDLLAVRLQVFVVEQGVPPDEEVDALDASALHVLARAPDGTPIGTGRLSEDRRIGRMAVLQPWRGIGLGGVLLQTLLDLARGKGWPELSLHAQLSAQAFYEAHGFEAEGEVFDECGIAHRRMRLRLTPAPARVPAALLPPPPQAAIVCDSHDGLRRASIALLDGAWYEAALLSADLDPKAYDHHDFLDAVRRLALKGRRARVRFLIRDEEKVVRTGHRLVELLRRLDSHLEVRVLAPEDQQQAAAFVVNDRMGFLLRGDASRPDAEGATHDVGRAGHLKRQFEELWQRAQPSLELRRLS